MNFASRTLLGVASLALGGGCSDSGNPEPAPSSDAGADIALDAVQDSRADAPDDGKGDARQDAGKEFSMRKPGSKELMCKDHVTGKDVETTFLEKDWICTLQYGTLQALVYVQSTPETCVSGGMSNIVGEYSHPVRQIMIGKGVFDLEDASYDWGGNHQNDALSAVFQGVTYRFYHSSFGTGWRKCQDMDCIEVSGAGLKENGCTEERTIPAVCRPIKPDGTYDELVDTFAPCKGDPNYADAG